MAKVYLSILQGLQVHLSNVSPPLLFACNVVYLSRFALILVYLDIITPPFTIENAPSSHSFSPLCFQELASGWLQG